MKKNLLSWILVLLTISEASAIELRYKTQHRRMPLQPISAAGTKFTDATGRQIIFNGLNYVNKNQGEGYLSSDSLEVYQKLKGWGINCLRLGIIWDGVEPEPGKYNEEYLNKLEQRVKWAAENDIYILLDMHQDLYGGRFGDGAPLWATYDDGLPHITGAVWSDAYLLSPAVHHAFDNFWADKLAADSIGIQTHYIAMWRHIAKRFAGYKNILGYDIMNEPFNGSDANTIMPLILSEYARMVAEETGHTPEEAELSMLWSNEKSRYEVLKQLSSANKYARIVDAAYMPIHQFETTKLQHFYQRASNAIREVDSLHILFWEHSYFVNAGIRSSLEPTKDANGNSDSRQAYAGHGYDLLTDTKEAGAQAKERVTLIFNRLNETATRMGIPLLVGEWGAFYGEDSSYIPSAHTIIRLLEHHQAGSAYWSYSSQIGSRPCFKEALVRPYPQAIAGSIIRYEFDPTNGSFSCSWNEKATIHSPTIIYLPDVSNIEKSSIVLSPGSISNYTILPIEGCSAGYLSIPSLGADCTRSLSLTLRKTRAKQ